MTALDPPATAECPDRTSCRHCGLIITWDEYCYVHLDGWADCGVKVTGGTVASSGEDGMMLIMDPVLTSTRTTRAEPADWDYHGTGR